MKTRYLIGNMKALEEIGRISLFETIHLNSFSGYNQNKLLQSIVFRTTCMGGQILLSQDLKKVFKNVSEGLDNCVISVI